MTFARITHRRVAALRAVTVAVAAGALLASCSTGSSGSTAVGDEGQITVVAAENFWGSIAQQLGGQHVKVTSIVDSPSADPHDYEPTPADARLVATAGLVIVNGVGYDSWASKLVAANPSSGRSVLDVGTLVGAPSGGNPHLWYDPEDVDKAIDAIVADYEKLDPAHATDYATSAVAYRKAALARYDAVAAGIKKDYSGTKVGASESIFAMVAPSLGLDLVTPSSFLTAISEGTDPTAADKRTIDQQIATKQIKVYVYNSQNATPDIQAQIKAAKARGIPVTTITETLSPAGAPFQDWQTDQLIALRAALDKASS